MILLFFTFLVTSRRRHSDITDDAYPEFVERKPAKQIDIRNPAKFQQFSTYKQLLDQMMPVFSQLKEKDLNKQQKKQLKSLVIKSFKKHGIDPTIPDNIELLIMAQRKIEHARSILRRLNKQKSV